MHIGTGTAIGSASDDVTPMASEQTIASGKAHNGKSLNINSEGMFVVIVPIPLL